MVTDNPFVYKDTRGNFVSDEKLLDPREVTSSLENLDCTKIVPRDVLLENSILPLRLTCM